MKSRYLATIFYLNYLRNSYSQYIIIGRYQGTDQTEFKPSHNMLGWQKNLLIENYLNYCFIKWAFGKVINECNIFYGYMMGT